MHRLVCTGRSALSEEESGAGSGVGRWRERGCKCHGMKGGLARFGLGDLISLHLTNLNLSSRFSSSKNEQSPTHHRQSSSASNPPPLLSPFASIPWLVVSPKLARQ